MREDSKSLFDIGMKDDYRNSKNIKINININVNNSTNNTLNISKANRKIIHAEDEYEQAHDESRSSAEESEQRSDEFEEAVSSLLFHKIDLPTSGGNRSILESLNILRAGFGEKRTRALCYV